MPMTSKHSSSIHALADNPEAIKAPSLHGEE